MGDIKESVCAAVVRGEAAAKAERAGLVDRSRLKDEDCVTQVLSLYETVRARTNRIVEPLEVEDFVVQTAPYMSPPRWHLGHTTWFFEMVLKDFDDGYDVESNDYLYYFNSYYEKFGSRIEKGMRGTKSRPTVRETLEYRRRIDEKTEALLTS